MTAVGPLVSLLFCGASAVMVAQAEAPKVSDLLAEGDWHYARRAEGAVRAVAKTDAVDAAIQAYRRAVAADPASAMARARLLRAFFFRGSFCGGTSAERRRLFEDARGVAEDGIGPLEKTLGRRRGDARLDALRRTPHAVSLYFWAAAAWGEWALSHGRPAAARHGAAARVRDLAQTVVALDATLEAGGGYRILGRLHHQSPRIPFLTFWVSKRDALRYLRSSYEADPENTVSQYFLADAILDIEPAQRAEAVELLQRCARSAPRPQYLVEDAHYAELARQRLAPLRRAP